MNNNFKTFLEKLKTPSKTFALLFSIFSIILFAITITLLCINFKYEIILYVLYAFSAIFLTYFVYIIIYFAPSIKKDIVNLLKKHKFTSDLLESFGYRSFIFASISFIINIAYSIFQATIAILSHSIWYGALATYYIAITLIRGGIIVTASKKNKVGLSLERQITAYRNCGIYLVFLNFALVGAIVQMVLSNQTFEYGGIMIYAVAAYTFYKLGMSIYHLIKAKKHNDYTLQSIKNLNLADSLVSLLALQTSLLYTFSQNYSASLPNSLTGGAVSICIIVIAVIMIINGQKKLNTLKEKNKNE